jgi:hypothetical protein
MPPPPPSAGGWYSLIIRCSTPLRLSSGNCMHAYPRGAVVQSKAEIEIQE